MLLFQAFVCWHFDLHIFGLHFFPSLNILFPFKVLLLFSGSFISFCLVHFDFLLLAEKVEKYNKIGSRRENAIFSWLKTFSVSDSEMQFKLFILKSRDFLVFLSLGAKKMFQLIEINFNSFQKKMSTFISLSFLLFSLISTWLQTIYNNHSENMTTL